MVHGDYKAARGEALHDAAGDAAFVERVGPPLADGMQRARQVGLDELVPRLQRRPLVAVAAQEDARRLRVRRQAVEATLRGVDEGDVHLEATQGDLLCRAGE